MHCVLSRQKAVKRPYNNLLFLPHRGPSKTHSDEVQTDEVQIRYQQQATVSVLPAVSFRSSQEPRPRQRKTNGRRRWSLCLSALLTCPAALSATLTGGSGGPVCPILCPLLCLSTTMSVRYSVCPVLCLSATLSVRYSVCPLLCLSATLSVRYYVCPLLCLSNTLSVHYSVCYSVCPLLCLSATLSVCPLLCLSTTLSTTLSVCSLSCLTATLSNVRGRTDADVTRSLAECPRAIDVRRPTQPN